MKRQQGWDQIEIKRISDQYFGGVRETLANAIGANTTERNWQLKISEHICKTFGSIEQFAQRYPPLENDIWPTDRSAYITSFWGWRPETWGCIGFGRKGRRNTYLRITTDPFIMVVFVTETAPTDQPALRGKVVGFYEISHEVGTREEFTDPMHHDLEPGKWPYSLRAIRAFSFLPEFQIGIRDLIPEYNGSAGQNIAAHGRLLSGDQVTLLRSLPFEQVPVFRGETAISQDIKFAETRKGRVASGAVNRSGFVVPGEPVDTPKELYILRLKGNTDAFLGRPSEGRSIIKVGLSMSPARRLASYQRAMPEAAFSWVTDRTTRDERGEPYPNYEVALAGEEAMKDYLAEHAEWLGGEFYAAKEAVISKAWQLGKSAAESFQFEGDEA